MPGEHGHNSINMLIVATGVAVDDHAAADSAAIDSVSAVVGGRGVGNATAAGNYKAVIVIFDGDRMSQRAGTPAIKKSKRRVSSRKTFLNSVFI